MPPRGRHRTRLPLRVIAAVAALLVGGTAVVLGGSALAEDNGGDSGGGSSILSALTGSSDDDSGGGESGDSKDGSGDGKSDDGDSKDSGDGKSDGEDSGDGKSDGQGSEDRKDAKGGGTGHDGDGNPDGGKDQSPDEAKKKADQKKDDPFPGRDKAQAAGADSYVNIRDVEKNGNIGEGGVFSKGSYSVDCGVSDHNNSDNYMAAPGKRNGAQHMHDYVGNRSTNGNSGDDSLEAAGTSCKNGDKSTFFWPVLRDLNGSDDDANADGGGKDGNVGRILTPEKAQLTFRGHGDEEISPLPAHLMMIMGNAKAKAQDGKNANSKYTCTGFEDRVTDQYPICPSGSNLVRLLDYPSCWDGQNLESKDLRSHMAFADERGNCEDGFTPVPALRITLTYDQPAGRAFSIDSFPDNQHDPSTDHSDYENFATEAQNSAGADCINANETCINV